MTILHEVYTALLSGITTKTGNEIHWINEDGCPTTIEPIDIEQNRYIIRYYYENGQKILEVEYQDGQQHGKGINWYENGQKAWETEYQNGRKHGKSTGWYCNGQKAWEDEYKNGQLHGTSMSWRIDGQKYLEIEYQNGKLVKKIL